MIVILGASGFLGSYLVEKLSKFNDRVYCPTRDQFFIENGQWVFSPSLESKLAEAKFVFNCVGLINLNLCADDSELSLSVNGDLPKAIARFVGKSAFYLHISTDAFYEHEDNFSTEDSKLLVSNNYSKHKLLGEEVFCPHANSIVLRTSFFGYNPRGGGLVNYLLDNAFSVDGLYGWDDCFTSSLHINHLTDAIMMCVSRPSTGIFNLGAQDSYSKYDFLKQVAHKLNLPVTIKNSTSPSNPRLHRNKNLGMDSNAFYELYGLEGWSVEDVVKETARTLKPFLDART
jgi:dTDP-4-dehydrorhamnose reductase